MPIILNSIQYTDVWGNVLPYYKGNVGDKQTALLTVSSDISINSVGNPISFDPTVNAFISSGDNWENEGFRVGDVVYFERLTDLGTMINNWTGNVTYVNGTEIRIDSVDDFYDITLGQIFTATVTGRNRQSIQCALNLIKNSESSGEFSLIDGEATRFTFEDISSLIVGGTQSGNLVGNQSGLDLISVSIERITGTSLVYKYEISIEFVNTGYYNSSWFTSSECLKPLYKFSFSSLVGEPFSQTQLTINDNANTGFFNQAHNTSIINSSLVSGIATLDYSQPTTFNVVVSGSASDLGIGACFKSIDDTYYKNKLQNQGVISMLLSTSDLALSTYTSELNTDGAGYTIEVNSITTVGLNNTINITFTPNGDFETFIDSNDSLDRQFYLWIKCGNSNLTIFDGQLSKVAPVGGALTIYSESAFLDHSNTETTGVIGGITDEFDTEDDLAYWCDFQLDKFGNYSAIKSRIIAYNDITLEKFTLQENVFDISGAPIDVNGKRLFDLSLTVNPELPTTSTKRDSKLKNKASLDTLTKYGVEFYYPFILRYEYWLSQLNANVFFYPNQNKNWQNYSQNGDWGLRLEIEVVKDGLAFIYQRGLIDRIYDYNTNITTDVEFIRTADNTTVSNLIEGEIMRIKSTHTLGFGTWNTDKTWGMITIRPKESAPRYISSTEIDFDNDFSNPIYPLTGLRCSLTFPTANTAQLECLLDCSKLPNANQFSIVPKIKDLTPMTEIGKTTAPDDTLKTTSPDEEIKTLA